MARQQTVCGDVCLSPPAASQGKLLELRPCLILTLTLTLTPTLTLTLMTLPPRRGAVAGQTLSQGDQQLRMAQTVALVLDGPAVLASARGLTRAEVALAARVAAEGRGIVAVVNKLDAVPPHSRQQVRAGCRFR